jgi:acetylcholinesterase
MASRLITTILLLLLAPLLTSAFPPFQPIPLSGPSVNLTYARYIGQELENGVNAFLGMRYAAAPLGDLRWRAPVEPPAMNIVQPARKVLIFPRRMFPFYGVF